MHSLKVLALLGACSLTLTTYTARAAYPEPGRPIKVIVGFAAGGGADASARLVTKKMGEILGVSFVVENRGGVGGVTATMAATEAKPDGYTLLWNGIGGVIFDPSSGTKKIRDPLESLIPITQTATLCNVAVVGVNSPFKSFKDLIASARANPGKYSYATPGIGSAGWISVQLLINQAKLNMVHIPYKGGSQLVTDVAAGQPDFGMVTVSTAQALGKGRLTPIAVTSGKRDPSLPNVPTFAESGASGYNANFWFGMFAPKGTPAEVVAKLNAVARQALTDPEVSKAHLGLGFVSSPTTPGEFAKIIASDSRKWAQVLEASPPK